MSKYKLDIDYKAHVDSLFEGVSDITDEQRTKMETILEATTGSIIEGELEKVQVEFDTKLEEKSLLLESELNKQTSDYLEYVVADWAKDNMVELTNQKKLILSENMMAGLGKLFTENNIDADGDKVDLVAQYENDISDLRSTLNESINASIELKNKVESNDKENIIRTIGVKLVDTKKEKFQAMCEAISFKSTEEFSKKATDIYEGIFSENVDGKPKVDLEKDKFSLTNPY